MLYEYDLSSVDGRLHFKWSTRLSVYLQRKLLIINSLLLLIREAEIWLKVISTLYLCVIHLLLTVRAIKTHA